VPLRPSGSPVRCPRQAAAGRTASQIIAGTVFRKVKLANQPASFASRPWLSRSPARPAWPGRCHGLNTLNTAVLLAGCHTMLSIAMRPQHVETVLLTQPERVLVSQPVRSLGWFQLEFLLRSDSARPVGQLALQCVLGAASAFRVAALPGRRRPGRLHDQPRAKDAGVLVMAGQDVQQGSPQIGVKR